MSARRLWAASEALHAVTYFHPTCLEALATAGTKGFWMGYFVGRMAPLGAVGPATAEAVAYGFSPERPARALPDGWSLVPPEVAVRVRAEAAAAALTSLGVDEPAPSTLLALEELRAASTPGGHPLGAANRDLPLADDPRQRLWQLVTWLREQRGDTHVALWTSGGLDGCEANLLTTAVHGQDPEVLRASRAWTPEAWSAAADRLAARGLLAGPDEPTEAGRVLHATVEAATDELSPVADEAVIDDLTRLAQPVLAAGLYPSPNPMGLPVDV
jgi:hypothetical protein